nr:MAG TPA: hypothetical protein [Bacteriophage sp.]
MLLALYYPPHISTSKISSPHILCYIFTYFLLGRPQTLNGIFTYYLSSGD